MFIVHKNFRLLGLGCKDTWSDYSLGFNGFDVIRVVQFVYYKVYILRYTPLLQCFPNGFFSILRNKNPFNT